MSKRSNSFFIVNRPIVFYFPGISGIFYHKKRNNSTRRADGGKNDGKIKNPVDNRYFICYNMTVDADVAQSVAHVIGNDEVTGSNPVIS